MFPNKDVPKPILENVFDKNGNLLLSSELKYKSHLLIEEIFKKQGIIEGITIYEYDNQDRIIKEITKDSSGKITESKDYSYKGNQLSKIRFFTEGDKLYMDSSIFQWNDGMISSGEIIWMETKDKEKILITSGDKKRTMTILDEKRKPIASVDFLYNKNGQLEERRFTQGESLKKNIFLYDNQGRLIEFSFHVKQNENWVLEKTHKLGY